MKDDKAEVKDDGIKAQDDFIELPFFVGERFIDADHIV